MMNATHRQKRALLVWPRRRVPVWLANVGRGLARDADPAALIVRLGVFHGFAAIEQRYDGEREEEGKDVADHGKKGMSHPCMLIGNAKRNFLVIRSPSAMRDGKYGARCRAPDVKSVPYESKFNRFD